MKDAAAFPGSALSSPLSHPAARKLRLAALVTGFAWASGLAGVWLAPSASAQNLIRNGGFESGNFDRWTVLPAATGSDFGVASLWSISQVGNGANLFGGPEWSSTPPFAPHSGYWAAYFGAVGTQFDAIEQTLAPHLPGSKYRISFWLEAGGPKGQFQAVWNGRVIYNTLNSPILPYQHIVVDTMSKGQSPTLAFQGLNLPPFYYLDDVSVTLVRPGSFYRYAQEASLTPNQRSVAAALDNAVSDPKPGSLIRFMEYQAPRNLPADFDRIAPEELTSIFTMGTAYSQVQSLNLQRRTDDIRSGSSGFSAAGLAVNGAGPSYSGGFDITTGVAGPSGSDGKESKEMKEVAPAENRWGTFLSGTGEWVSVGATDNARGYTLDSGGFTLGVDYKVTPNFAIGLAAGYTGTTADLTDHGRIGVNGGKLGLYSTAFSGGWYADAAAFGGYSSYDTRRSAIQGDARGDTDGGEINALFGTGYDFKKGGLAFGPTATFNYTYVGLNGYTEHDSLAPLNIHGGDEESLRTALGFKASYDWKLSGLTIKPEIRAAWQHEFGDTAYDLSSSFANGAGSPFTVAGPRLGRDSALLGAGFAIQCSERCSIYTYYDGELGRTNYQSTSVTGGIRVAF